MSTELVALVRRELSQTDVDGSKLYRAFLSSCSEKTREAYARDIADFAAFLGAPDATAAVARLLAVAGGGGNGVLLDWRTHMIGEGHAPATINRHLSAVRSAVKLARTLGLTNWEPEIPGLKSSAFRDTAGPGLDGTRAILGRAREQDPVKAARDVALIRLMFDLGLRRFECTALDLEHYEGARRRVWILGKGKKQREPRSLPEETAAAIDAWIAMRAAIAKPDQPALFVGMAGGNGRRRVTGRLTGRGLHHVIAGAGKNAGVRAWPHGLRHASITTALDMNGGDVRAAQRHARHASPATTMIYDDNRRDLAGRVAETIAKAL